MQNPASPPRMFLRSSPAIRLFGVIDWVFVGFFISIVLVSHGAWLAGETPRRRAVARLLTKTLEKASTRLDRLVRAALVDAASGFSLSVEFRLGEVQVSAGGCVSEASHSPWLPLQTRTTKMKKRTQKQAALQAPAGRIISPDDLSNVQGGGLCCVTSPSNPDPCGERNCPDPEPTPTSYGGGGTGDYDHSMDR